MNVFNLSPLLLKIHIELAKCLIRIESNRIGQIHIHMRLLRVGQLREKAEKDEKSTIPAASTIERRQIGLCSVSFVFPMVKNFGSVCLVFVSNWTLIWRYLKERWLDRFYFVTPGHNSLNEIRYDYKCKKHSL